MRKLLARVASGGAALTLAVGVLGAAVVAAPSASAATGLLTITNKNTGGTTGANTDVLAFTTPAACNAATAKHVAKVTAVTATDPANQTALEGWIGKNFYSPSTVGIPGPYTQYPAENNLQGLANTYALQLYAGSWTIELRCQNSLGSTIYDTYTGRLVFDSPTAWHADNTAPAVGTTTTIAASPTSAQVGSPVTFTATVTAADSTTPVGSVAFKEGSTTLGTGTVGADGKATFTTSNLTVGSHSVTATFTGTGYTTSSSQPVTVTTTAAPAQDTQITLVVSPTSGPEYQSVTLTGTVSPSGAAGTCTFKDGTTTVGSAPVSGGTCAVTLSSFGQGAHSFTASFAPTNTQAYNPSTSAAVTASYTASEYAPDPQTVVVTVPRGTLAVSTPYEPGNPLDLGTLALRPDGSCYDGSAVFDKVTVTDTRAGQLGWKAFLARAPFSNGAGGSIAADRESFTQVTAKPVAGNALQTISVTDIPAGGANATTPAQFASAPAGMSVGTIGVTAKFGLECVPTSTPAGSYTATVVFTVL